MGEKGEKGKKGEVDTEVTSLSKQTSDEETEWVPLERVLLI